jgi:hypothetical protein
MRFRGEPEAELGVRFEHFEFFLEHGQPGSHQVQVLETDPLTLLRSLLDCLNRNLVLPAAHGQLVVASTAHNLLSKLLQLG